MSGNMTPPKAKSAKDSANAKRLPPAPEGRRFPLHIGHPSSGQSRAKPGLTSKGGFPAPSNQCLPVRQATLDLVKYLRTVQARD